MCICRVTWTNFDIDLLPHWRHDPIDILRKLKIGEITHSSRPETT